MRAHNIVMGLMLGAGLIGGRSFPEARALFGTNVAVFERAWYGLRDVAMEEIDEFRERAARMKSILTGGTGAAA